MDSQTRNQLIIPWEFTDAPLKQKIDQLGKELSQKRIKIKKA